MGRDLTSTARVIEKANDEGGKTYLGSGSAGA